ncbi:MAG: SpoIIE family protein phosphatase [Thiotrichaceae bacterium]
MSCATKENCRTGRYHRFRFSNWTEEDITKFIGEARIQLEPHDAAVFYTDGITEAERKDGQQYGLERLCSLVKRHWQQSAGLIRHAIIADVREFIGEIKFTTT